MEPKMKPTFAWRLAGASVRYGMMKVTTQLSISREQIPTHLDAKLTHVPTRWSSTGLPYSTHLVLITEFLVRDLRHGHPICCSPTNRVPKREEHYTSNNPRVSTVDSGRICDSAQAADGKHHGGLKRHSAHHDGASAHSVQEVHGYGGG